MLQVLFLQDGNQKNELALSGKPGYLINKPVRIAVKENDAIESASISKMTIMDNKQCADIGAERKTVLFGQNLYVTCFYQFAKTNPCANHQGKYDN